MLTLLSVALVGCATYPSVVRKLATFDLDCQEDKVEVENLSGGYGGNYLAQGCAKKAMYICETKVVACSRTGDVKNK